MCQRRANTCVSISTRLTLLDGGAVGVRRELGQAGLLGARVVGEDRVLAGGAGGAARVRVAGGAPRVRVVGGVLVHGHRQLQVLLEERRRGRESGGKTVTG